MPSDMTNTKLHAYVTETGDPRAPFLCPTCARVTAMDLTHSLLFLETGQYETVRELRWVEASHVRPAADGGKRVALECNRCNRKRGRALWVTDRPTYKVWKRSGPELRAARASIGDLIARGYPRP